MAHLRVLSLGAGVQSTTLALMAAHGQIEPPDCAIFADTQWEPKAVYDHLKWLMSGNVLPYPVHIVTAGSIRDDILRRRDMTAGRYVALPFFIVNPDSSHGIGRRQCTKEFKVEPIQRKVRELLGYRPRQRIPTGSVEQLIGISVDEAHRAKPSQERWVEKVFPLLDKRMNRGDCYAWLERHGYPKPPKSACIGCPFTSDQRWLDRKTNQPDEWDDAVALDAYLRTGDQRGMDGAEYLHAARVPLDRVDFSRRDPTRQADLFGNECEGMCGV